VSVDNGTLLIYSRQFADFVDNDLFTVPTLEWLFHTTKLYRVRIVAPTIEVGPVRKLLHMHWTMSILHSGTIELRGLQKRWQEYINNAVDFIYSCNVDLTLLTSSKAKNYNMKTADDEDADADGLIY
jgi:hypothetical protein